MKSFTRLGSIADWFSEEDLTMIDSLVDEIDKVTAYIVEVYNDPTDELKEEKDKLQEEFNGPDQCVYYTLRKTEPEVELKVVGDHGDLESITAGYIYDEGEDPYIMISVPSVWAAPGDQALALKVAAEIALPAKDRLQALVAHQTSALRDAVLELLK